VSTRVDRSQSVSADTTQQLSKSDYERLANLRYALRRFSRQTELEARRVGLTPQQYLLLLSLKGFPGRDWASITELAERLQIRHNAVIGLVNRAEERDLVRRAQDPGSNDRRIVNIHITPAGERILTSMSAALRNERQRVRIALEAVDQEHDPLLGAS
jgi:DNA-binding MarR family transcriptional regulator